MGVSALLHGRLHMPSVLAHGNGNGNGKGATPAPAGALHCGVKVETAPAAYLFDLHWQVGKGGAIACDVVNHEQQTLLRGKGLLGKGVVLWHRQVEVVQVVCLDAPVLTRGCWQQAVRVRATAAPHHFEAEIVGRREEPGVTARVVFDVREPRVAARQGESAATDVGLGLSEEGLSGALPWRSSTEVHITMGTGKAKSHVGDVVDAHRVRVPPHSNPMVALAVGCGMQMLRHTVPINPHSAYEMEMPNRAAETHGTT